MTGREIGVLVVSCDRYRDLWEPFFRCFFKYWPDCPFRVYLGTNHQILADSRVTTLAIGEDRSYAENLRAMLECIPEAWVIFWVDDRLVSSPVQTGRVLELTGRAQEQNAAYLKLIPEPPLGHQAKQGEMGLIPRGTFYRVSMTVALWRKDCLAQLLVPGETAWDLEKKGSARSALLTEPFYGLTRNCISHPPIPHVHLLVKGRLMYGALGFLRQEGLTEEFSARRRQTWHSRIYVALFQAVWGGLAGVLDRFIVDKGPGRPR